MRVNDVRQKNTFYSFFGLYGPAVKTHVGQFGVSKSSFNPLGNKRHGLRRVETMAVRRLVRKPVEAYGARRQLECLTIARISTNFQLYLLTVFRETLFRRCVLFRTQ